MHRRQFLKFVASPTLAVIPALITVRPARAAQDFRFASIDGGFYQLNAWRGQPILVVNTASLCGFTGQYNSLQALHDVYAGRVVVLAVPSDDFAQELGSDAEVAEFCEVNFSLTLPMTTIQSVRGPDAHPFYRWMARDHGFVPQWNFNKVLLDGSGQPVATWGSNPDPMGRRIRSAIEGLLIT